MLKGLGTYGLSVVLLLSLGACGPSVPDGVNEAMALIPDDVDYNFHIRPILSDRCYQCHGPDAATREADLRLDQEESAQHVLGSGVTNSELWARLLHDDPEKKMPPPESKFDLSDYEKALIARWLDDGAPWAEHWSFISPEAPVIPQDFPKDWYVGNEIDHFILAKLDDLHLPPSQPASRERLIRRLSFDLRGLPPSLQEVDDFVSSTDPNAYEDLIDRFMDSDAFAERMTLEWLDVSRFADSHGLHADGLREMWPWRDWVIDAFKRNIPYDDFVGWQLAGDLYPNATREQLLATGFHRNHPFSTESGVVTEEYRLKAVADRTNTTATAFLGLTFECAACHDHKFDPISQKEYYEMSAFFNNIPELGMVGTDRNFGPNVLLPDSTTELKLKQLDASIARLEQESQEHRQNLNDMTQFIARLPEEVASPPPQHYFPLDRAKQSAKDKNRALLDGKANAYVFGEYELVEGYNGGSAVRIDQDFDGIRFTEIAHFDLYEPYSVSCWIKTEKTGKYQSIIGNIGEKNSGWRGWVVYLDETNHLNLRIVSHLPENLIEIRADESLEVDQWHHVTMTYDGSASATGARLFLNGKRLGTQVVSDRLYKTILPTRKRDYTLWEEKPLALGAGSKYLYTDTDDGIFEGAFDQVRVFYRGLSELEVAALHASDMPDDVFTSTSDQRLSHYLLAGDPDQLKRSGESARLRKEKYTLLETVRESMILKEMEEPRATFVLQRGQYDAPGQRVSANTPSQVLTYSAEYPTNRFGLVQWLFDEANPLTSRVAVNRYWQMLFGRGLVSTPHDFGSQGALPSHPALLDWLAVYFRSSQWDLRKLLKLMVMSSTYRQISETTKLQLELDPDNIYLSRSPSYRLPAELIRDNLLWASGLLSTRVGGPSVKPYQPAGLWEEKNEFSGYLNTYQRDSGQNLYRKSMYTFIRRTSPPPSMLTFDATDRSICVVQRESTSSPLQSLILLNDPQFVEAARLLAERMQSEGGGEITDQIRHGFRLTCGRYPSAAESMLLRNQYDKALQKFKENPTGSKQLLTVGERFRNVALPPEHTAALAMVANTMMNFDEAYMRR